MRNDGIYDVRILRTGLTEDGRLELQLIYSGNRGSTLWFRLSRRQAMKLAREIEEMEDDAAADVPYIARTRTVFEKDGFKPDDPVRKYTEEVKR